MNDQARLLELAQSHAHDASVRALLLTIHESQTQAQSCLSVLRHSSETYQKCVGMDDGYRVPLDTTDIVTYAAKANAAMNTLAAALMTLASVLSARGEDINY